MIQQKLTKTKTTRCSAIAENPHCRVHYSFRQKVAKSGRLELKDNILRTL